MSGNSAGELVVVTQSGSAPVAVLVQPGESAGGGPSSKSSTSGWLGTPRWKGMATCPRFDTLVLELKDELYSAPARAAARRSPAPGPPAAPPAINWNVRDTGCSLSLHHAVVLRAGDGCDLGRRQQRRLQIHRVHRQNALQRNFNRFQVTRIEPQSGPADKSGSSGVGWKFGSHPDQNGNVVFGQTDRRRGRGVNAVNWLPALKRKS